jgi:hypothetical protein
MRHVKKYGTSGQTTDDNVMRRMRVACWITNATNTHSECVIIIAFPVQQWIRERPSMLRHIYTAFLVTSYGKTIIHCVCNKQSSELLQHVEYIITAGL